MRHKKRLITGGLASAAVAGAAILSSMSSQPHSHPIITTTCSAPSDGHVYNPERLTQHGCMTISGRVEEVRSEVDGDYHYLFKLNHVYDSLLNQVNMDKQKGDLILEEPCQRPVTQQDAINSCLGFHSPLPRLILGQSYEITGHYVTDMEHGWNEIHGIKTVKQN